MNAIQPLLEENFALGVHPGQWRINDTSSTLGDFPIAEVEGAFQPTIWYHIKQFAKEIFRSYCVQWVIYQLNCICCRGPVNPVLDGNARKIFAQVHQNYKNILPEASIRERCDAWRLCEYNLFQFGKLNLSEEARAEWKAAGRELWQLVEETEATLAIKEFPLEFDSGHSIFTGPAPHFELCMESLKTKKVEAIVSLLEPEAMEAFDLYESYAKHHMHLIPFPIEDMNTPASIQEVDHLINEIKTHLSEHNVYIHCMGGRGRTGLVMACITASQNPGKSAEQVINHTRFAIPGAIETPEQEEFIEAYVKAHSNSTSQA